MKIGFVDFLVSQNWMQILRAIYYSKEGRTLRELVDLTSCSPGGVQDILKRLYKNKILSKRKRGNRILYQLNIAPHEKHLLTQIFDLHCTNAIKVQSKKLQSKSQSVVGWIDAMQRVYTK